MDTRRGSGWGKFFGGMGQGMAYGMAEKMALKKALIAAGEMGMVDKPIQPVEAMDPRRMLPGFAYGGREQIPTYPGPGGRAITGGVTTPGPEAMMRPGGLRTDLGAHPAIGRIPNLSRLLTGAKIGKMGREPLEDAANFANKYAKNMVGEYGALEDPDAYDKSFNKGIAVYRLLTGIGRGDSPGGVPGGIPGGAPSPIPGGIPGAEAPAAIDTEGTNINAEVAFLEGLDENSRWAVLTSEELDPTILEAYLARHPEEAGKYKGRGGGSMLGEEIPGSMEDRVPPVPAGMPHTFHPRGLVRRG